MITQRDPNTIYLGGGHGNAGEGGYVPENTLPAKGSITPGMLCEYYTDGSATKLRVHSTANNPDPAVIALESLFLNPTNGVDTPYPDGELVNAGRMQPGSQFWGLLASGQNVAANSFLQSNGDGTLKAATSGHEKYVAREAKNATSGQARIRAEVL